MLCDCVTRDSIRISPSLSLSLSIRVSIPIPITIPIKITPSIAIGHTIIAYCPDHCQPYRTLMPTPPLWSYLCTSVCSTEQPTKTQRASRITLMAREALHSRPSTS